MSDPRFFRNYLDIIQEAQPGDPMGADPQQAVKSIEMQLTQAKEQEKQLKDQIRMLTQSLADAKRSASQAQAAPTANQPQAPQPQGSAAPSTGMGTMPQMPQE